jgi:hypothetical protein
MLIKLGRYKNFYKFVCAHALFYNHSIILIHHMDVL